MEQYTTKTATYTVIDIRKTFEGFDADLRMIARRTGKWTEDYVENILHDVIKLAEAKYLSVIDVVLRDTEKKVIRATKFTVNENGTSITGDKAGGNDWTNIPNTELIILLSYSPSWKALSPEGKEKFRSDSGFKNTWSPSDIDNTFPHLTKSNAQMFASNGFEIQKSVYK